MSEHQEQSLVVSWFKTVAYKKYAGCLVSIPNGSHIAGTPRARAVKVAKMKKEGLKVGASDIFIAVPRGGKHGLWVEMKDRKKTRCSVSKDQLDHLELMALMGYEAIWCAGFDVACAAITTYMNQGER